MDEFEQVKRQLLVSIDTQRSDPQALASLSIGRHLSPYPPEHWNYSPTLDERAERLKAVRLEDARRCHAELVGASHSDLAVVGDFDPDEVTRLAGTLFGDWKNPAPYRRIPSRYFDVKPMERLIETPDKANAVFRAGLNLKLRDDHPDYPALVLGNYLIGGSSAARLARRIREGDGLSYSVGSWLSASAARRGRRVRRPCDSRAAKPRATEDGGGGGTAARPRRRLHPARSSRTAGEACSRHA